MHNQCAVKPTQPVWTVWVNSTQGTAHTRHTHLPRLFFRLLGVPSGSPLVITTKGNGCRSSQFSPAVPLLPTTMRTVSLEGLPSFGFHQCLSLVRASKYDGDGDGDGVAESGDGVGVSDAAGDGESEGALVADRVGDGAADTLPVELYDGVADRVNDGVCVGDVDAA